MKIIVKSEKVECMSELCEKIIKHCGKLMRMIEDIEESEEDDFRRKSRYDDEEEHTRKH